MILDRNQGRMLVFGGMETAQSYLDDVWALSIDGDHWSKLDVAGKRPAARGQHAAAIDDAGRRMLVHGRTGDHGQLADTWMLELEPSLRWFRVEASGSAPPILAQQFAAFDPETHRFIVVGNEASPPPATFDGVSVWALSMEGTPRWQRYCPTGTRPATADGAVWTDDGLFVTSKGSARRFDPSTATCD